MAANGHFVVAFILFTLTLAVLSSPSNSRAEVMDESRSLENDPTASAVSLPEYVKDSDDLSNIPEPLSKDSKGPQVYSLNIWSAIKNRYATTLVTSCVVNRGSKSAEVVFRFLLPNNAFISGFLMEVKGKVYKAYVKEKEEAKAIYNAAKQRGLTAAHVAVSARETNLFAVSVNLEPSSKITFNLTYEELLTRRNGMYDHVIHLATCDQVIREMTVEVYINESQNITGIKVPEPTISYELGDAVSGGFVEVSKLSPKSALITYRPSIELQKEFLHQPVDNSLSSSLLVEEESSSQRLLVQYDVDHLSRAGEILLNDGYFVHFFAPSANIFGNSTRPNKHAIFVLDTSGSMKFQKLGQLKEAMEHILSSLNVRDYLSIVQFSSSAIEWPAANVELDTGEEIPHATPFNIVDAKAYISRMEADGGTNIAEALKLALNIAKGGIRNKQSLTLTGSGQRPRADRIQPNEAQPIIIFLTDGHPTNGDTSLSSILQGVRDRNNKIKVPIFSLAFGENADFKFLRKLSLQNHGFARKIYSSADAALQLKSFFQEISSPLLNNVTFSYVNPHVDQSSLTELKYHTYFDGTEVIIAGRVNDKTLSPNALGGLVSSTYYEVPVPVSTLNTYEVPEKMSSTSAGYSRKKADDDVTEELEKFTMKYWPSQTLEKEHMLGSLERLWAFLTIRQLLDKNLASEEDEDLASEEDKDLSSEEDKDTEGYSIEVAQGKETMSPAKKKALQLALKYGFVTPLTSLVVVKPPERDDNASYSNGDINDPINDYSHYFDNLRGKRVHHRGIFHMGSLAAASPSPSTIISTICWVVFLVRLLNT